MICHKINKKPHHYFNSFDLIIGNYDKRIANLIFNFLEKSNKVFMQNHKKNIDKIIKECIKIKIDTVEKDFKENDLRSILNFGHTIGHALEKKYSYKFSHGDCIGTGMAIESLIANNIYKLSTKNFSRILKLLDKFELKDGL